MLLLRVLGIVVAIAIGAGLLSYLFTRDPRYLHLAGRLAKYALIFAFIVMALMFFERVLEL